MVCSLSQAVFEKVTLETGITKMIKKLVYCFLLVLLADVAYASEAYQNQALTLHNTYRKKHHAPDMKLDDEMNKLAVQCAEYYAKKKTIDHSCPHKKSYGENLAGGQISWSKDQCAKESTDMWYNEVKDYDYNKATFDSKTGHFTQVVWKKCDKMGFGYATVNGYTVGVGLYNPQGNMQGEFKDNVLKS